MGGRGSSGGSSKSASKSTTKNVRKVSGVSVGENLFSTYSEVSKLSKNTIWIDNVKRPHGVFKADGKEIHLTGDKKDKYGLLDKVNTAVVHTVGISSDSTKREITALNKRLKEFRDIGFDIQRINVSRDESIVYIKRKLFTRRF